MGVTNQDIDRFLLKSPVLVASIERLGKTPLLLSIGDYVECCLDGDRPIIFPGTEEETDWYTGTICNMGEGPVEGSFHIDIIRGDSKAGAGAYRSWQVTVFPLGNEYDDTVGYIKVLAPWKKDKDWDE